VRLERIERPRHWINLQLAINLVIFIFLTIANPLRIRNFLILFLLNYLLKVTIDILEVNDRILWHHLFN